MFHIKFVLYSRFGASVFGNEWSFCHKHFCDSDRKRQYSCSKLPEDGHHVAYNVKQSDLNVANPLDGFQHVAKNSKSKEHGVKTVQISSDYESSIVSGRFRQGPRDNS